MHTKNKIPIVGVPACVRDLENRPFHGVGERFLDAIARHMNAIPMVIPAIGSHYDTNAVLDRVDAVMVTGSTSNVSPCRYGAELLSEDEFLDHKRDATTLPMIREVIERGMPLLCICRGIQELNVAYGGTLHQKINTLPNTLDHRDLGLCSPNEKRFALRHPIRLVEGGILADLTPLGMEFDVNSLHTQGINRLADELQVEATAPDGVIEAVSVKDAKNFAIGVQWHPEYRVGDHPFAKALFDRFADATRGYANNRT